MKKILLGNEAIVQGALEAGVNFVSVYPGTPSSEIGDIFSEIAGKYGVYFEFSTNEKVALEAGIGASYSGLRTLVAMKNFGLNVALDAFLPFVYTGTIGSTVIIVADDPSCHSSGQSEENTRPFADLSHVVMLEPSDAQEAKNFTIFAFELSEKFSVPVVVRITTRVAHQRMPIEVGETKVEKKEGKFLKDARKFVTMPPRVMEMKKELLGKIEEIRKFSEKSPINKTSRGRASGTSKFGIITSGVSYLYVKEALKELDLEIPIMKIGFFNPLPDKKISAFIKNLKKVLIVEELEGYLEREIKVLAKEINPKLEIYGKNLLSVIGELNTNKVLFAIGKLIGKRLPARGGSALGGKIPVRFPRLCQGCPYWLVFGAIKKMAPEGTIFGGDIGCYMLAGFPPHEIQDYILCMGSSISIGHGIKKASQNKQKLISLIGDSTFFHSGVPALINSVYNKSSPLIVVLDNRITAMTGHQPNAGEVIKIEDIAKACGVRNVKVIDPTNINELQEAITEFVNKDETSVIVARKMCAYYARKIANK